MQDIFQKEVEDSARKHGITGLAVCATEKDGGYLGFVSDLNDSKNLHDHLGLIQRIHDGKLIVT